MQKNHVPNRSKTSEKYIAKRAQEQPLDQARAKRRARVCQALQRRANWIERDVATERINEIWAPDVLELTGFLSNAQLFTAHVHTPVPKRQA